MNRNRRPSRLGAQLAFLVGGFVVVLLVVSGLAYQTLSYLKVNGPVYQTIVLQKDLLADVLPPPMYIIETYLTTLQMVGESDPAAIKEHVERIQALKKDFATRTAYWSGINDDSAGRKVMLKEASQPARVFFETVEREFVPAVQRQDKAAASALAYGRLRELYLAHRKEIDKTVAFATEDAQATEQAAAAADRQRMLLLLVVLGAGLALVIGYSYRSCGGITSTLKSVAGELSNASSRMTSVAGRVSDGSQSLAKGAGDQAASLEETSASMEEMSSVTKRSAERAAEAAQLMNGVDHHLVRSREDLQAMVTAMAAIAESSGKISRIIKTIDEIAFQTNILALNAAVEAARAGDAGLGFAVVAEEVRNLARRSADAARDTAGLIEEATRNAREGRDRVDVVAASVAGFAESVAQVKAIAEEVSTSSHQQAEGIAQVTQAVSRMEQITQRTAEAAQQSAAASDELNTHAQATMSQVRSLQDLAGGTVGPTPAAAADLSFEAPQPADLERAA
jgi:hypothetical protein